MIMMDLGLNKINCYLVKKDTLLTQKQMEEIAALIYDTDPYIYPALFGNKENAIRLIPALMLKGDQMFDAQNLYLAQLKEEIVGLILWKKGKLFWDVKLFEETANQLDICLPNDYLLVVQDYIREYEAVEDEEISIINVSVNPNFQGKKIGYQMLVAFLETYEKELLSLYVLKENKGAVHLYEKCGFHIVDEQNGFPFDKNIRCLKMTR